MSTPKFKITGNSILDNLLTQINHGANVNIKNNNGCTALIIASYNRHIDICKLLIENGADVNIQDNDGETALMATRGNIAICKLLIENGANVNIQDNEGNTILIKSAYTMGIEIFKLLIENGADINIQNNDGYTALTKASFNGYINVCKFLIENNADINLKNKRGKTAIEEMKRENIYDKVNPYKILGLKYFKEVFKEHAENYLDIFETTLYSHNLELDDIKANIEMFYSTIIARMDNNAINEDSEL